ncbi:MAG: creatininase family protein [Thermoplasmatota archaeon]
MRWDDLSSAELRSRLHEQSLVVWPVGILESHGPHLPLATDAIQAEWGAERVASRTGAIVLSPLRFGNGTATRNYPGTVSLSFDSLRGFARDVLAEVYRNGVRRVMVISGHLGRDHMSALRVAATDVKTAHPDLQIAVLSDWDIVYEIKQKGMPRLAPNAIPADDGHGGTLETSRMIAIAPHLVKMDRAPGAIARLPQPEFRIGLGLERDYPDGVIGGDASRASSEIGREVNRIVEDRLVTIAEGLLKAPLGPPP